MFSKKILGLEIWEKDLLKIPFQKGEFDIVTIWHVLEHVFQPEEYIKYLYSVMKKKGILLIEVPNFNSWTRKITGKYWLGLDIKYHRTFFTPKSLLKLLRKYNFRIINLHTFSLEYSVFISTQSIISKLTKTDSLFFEWLQSPGFKLIILLHVILFIIFSPVCFIINLLLYFTQKGEVLLVIARKE